MRRVTRDDARRAVRAAHASGCRCSAAVIDSETDDVLTCTVCGSVYDAVIYVDDTDLCRGCLTEALALLLDVPLPRVQVGVRVAVTDALRVHGKGDRIKPPRRPWVLGEEVRTTTWINGIGEAGAVGVVVEVSTEHTGGKVRFSRDRISLVLDDEADPVEEGGP